MCKSCRSESEASRRETEVSVLQKRYDTCKKERESERTRLEESEKIQGTVMATLRELVREARRSDV